MWKDYAIGFIKKNRASTVSVMAAAFIAALLLSILCSFFYNTWVYDVESVILEEGDWQGRVTGSFGEEEVNMIRRFANVERVVDSGETVQGSGVSEERTLDLYFRNPRTIYRDMTLLSQKLNLQEEQIAYHYRLLAMYFIRIPGDSAPRMILPLYFVVVVLMCISLILVIHNSFAVTMNARVRQLGILSGIGATPGQIRTCLIQEAAALCILPLVAGSLLGIGSDFGLIRMLSSFVVEMAGRHEVIFRYHPLIFVLTMAFSTLTVLVSAWIPARKLARLTPMEAVRGAEESGLKGRKHSPVLSMVWGIEGELAGNALKAQKKALRTSTVSLTLSFLGFTIVLCFLTLSDISTEYTYFARYQDAWDVMATVKDARLETLDFIEALQEAEQKQGAASCSVYQKAYALARIPQRALSDELNAMGGMEKIAGQRALLRHDNGDAGEYYLVQAPIIILDDASFQDYCRQAGIAPGVDGAVVINRIWDSANSSFRYPKYIPYVEETSGITALQSRGLDEDDWQDMERGTDLVEIPLLGYTSKEPVLREEYEDYALVHVVPVSLWINMTGLDADVEPDVFVRVLDRNREEVSEKDAVDERIHTLARLEEPIAQTAGVQYETEIENRVQEKVDNDRLLTGYKIVLGMFCALLAMIGIANVFSYTMGFLRQRRKEFARYLSVGMTPDGLKKMFCIEIMVIAGRPVAITLPLTVLFVELASGASDLNSMEFWSRAPYLPILGFIASIFGFVALAYHIGGRRVLRDDLAAALRSSLME